MNTPVDYKKLPKEAKRLISMGMNKWGNPEFHSPTCKNRIADSEQYEIASVRDCVDSVWGENCGSYYAESDYTPEQGWKEYRKSTTICPCVGKLQDETKKVK